MLKKFLLVFGGMMFGFAVSDRYWYKKMAEAAIDELDEKENNDKQTETKDQNN